MAETRDTLVVESPDQLWRIDTRRRFLKMLGIGGSIVLLPAVFGACDDDADITDPGTGTVTLNLSNDTGILNYAYALEQLEAAFYVAVVNNTAVFNTFTAAEQELLADLRNHEVAHRAFFAQVLGNGRIRALALNQTTVATAISSKANILQYAEIFEDLGVAAYNGAGKYLTSADNLTVAGKIVSVEARHAAAIRDARDTGTGASAGTRFANADVVANTGTYAGLDVKLEPAAVLAAVDAANVVATDISIGTQPPTRAGTPDRAPAHS